MLQKSILVFLFLLECGIGSNISGTSYFFKTNGNNEFRVYNRIHYLNHNISDIRYNPHPANIRVIQSQPVFREPKKTLDFGYLDPEWDYDHATPTNASTLPPFIEKFYEQRVAEPNKTNTIRILFNSNRNTSSTIIRFNLDSLNTNENVSDADLYFYWPLENTSSIFKTSVVLKLYQIENQLRNDLNESRLTENPDLHKLFNIIYISKAHKGWQIFKIKKPVDNWIGGEDNLGLLLTISSYDDNKLISIFNDSNDGIFRTFAVIKMHQNNTSHFHNEHRNVSVAVSVNEECGMRNWYVHFGVLRWDSFIIRPDGGFNARECSGKCNNHGTINHVKMRYFDASPVAHKRICCVPTTLSSLPIMFFDRYQNVVIKTYDNMIVDECGCI